MDHDSLLALLRNLALASAPVITSGCNGTGPFAVSCPTQEATVSLASLQGDATAPDAGDADGGLADLCSQAFPGRYIDSCTLITADGGQAVHVVYNNYCASGRRPAGLVSPAGLASTSPVVRQNSSAHDSRKFWPVHLWPSVDDRSGLTLFPTGDPAARSETATPAGWKPGGVIRARRANLGPKRTDFGRSQAFSPDPSGTLNFAGLLSKSTKRFGSTSVSNPAGVAPRPNLIA